MVVSIFPRFSIQFKIKGVNPKYMFYQTKTERFKKWAKTTSTRSGQPGINAQEYSTYKIELPHPDEEQKIADFLTAFDRKIHLVRQELEQAKTLKKGLLQQMFV